MRLPQLLCFLTLIISINGCSTINYYQQAIGGHLSLSSQRQPINRLLNNPETPSTLRAQLEKVNALTTFAEQQLALPTHGTYSSYANLERPYVVWNVFASPEFSLQAKTWCYPLIGCASYKGYYSEADAQAYARDLRASGMDVYVAGISAYSTLGWFNDPVLNTFIYRSDAQLANLIFHELAHQKLYIKGDTQFNESFATVIAKEGVKRWLLSRGDNDAYKGFLAAQQKEKEFTRLVLGYRDKLETLYRSNSRDPQKRAEKQRLIEQLRTAHHQLKTRWGGYSDYEKWFNDDLNNAQLNTVSTYFDLVPALEALLAQNNDDLNAFYQACQKLKNMTPEERNSQLRIASI